MRKPPITFDAIFAALAVLGATAACSKAERAGAEPPSATPPAATAPASATPAAQATAAPAPAPAPAPTTATPAPEEASKNATKDAVRVDAGVERAPTAPSPKPSKGGSAACGATGCSAEMRKGGK